MSLFRPAQSAMAYQIRHKKRSYPGFGRMLLVSVILHTGAIVGLVTAGVRSPIQSARPEPYIVALVAPSALTPSPGSRPAPDPPPLGQAQEPPPAPPVTKEPVPAVKKPSPPALKKKAAQPTKKPSPPAPKKQAKKPKAQKKPVAKSAKPQPSPQPSMSRHARETRQLAEAVDRVRQNMRTAERTARQPVGSRTVGGSGSGGGPGRRPPAFVGYTVLVQQRVKDSWIVTHQRAGLTAVVQFGIRPNGEIADIELTRSSGNAAFDQSALRAVHHANPLPPPPVEHLHEFLSQKVQVAFGE